MKSADAHDRPNSGPLTANASRAEPSHTASQLRPKPRSIDIAAAFSTPPPPLDFVLPGMLSGTVGALIAPGGAGKSMMSLQLATVVACGVELLGMEVQPPQGRVVILAGEDPAAALEHRLHSLGHCLSPAQREQATVRLDIKELLGCGLDVMEPDWFDWLVECAQDARLIIVDTLRRVHTLDENSSGEMAALLDRLEHIVRLTGCSIVFLHHASKAAAMGGTGDQQQASRGSSVLVDNIRWQSYLSTMSPAEAEAHGVPKDRRGMYVRWGVSKQNYGKPMTEAWLQRSKGGLLVPAILGEARASFASQGRRRRGTA